MKIQDHSSCRGFSLVELLIVAAVLGLIVAMAMPNLLNAIQKARQARTIADANAIAKGCALYQQDLAHYPVAAAGSTAEVLRPHLLPYTENFSAIDGWRREYLYTSTDGESYTLVSLGLAGELDEPWSAGTTSYFVDDIVLIDGAFYQVPDGPQQ
jgi:general secretion pathway protein G